MTGTYSRKYLAGGGRQCTIRADRLAGIAFPLGGPGAGCLHLGRARIAIVPAMGGRAINA